MPSHVILGAQKAGTTSLYHLINQHPDALTSRRRETHYLDWDWERAAALELSPRQREAAKAALGLPAPTDAQLKYVFALGVSPPLVRAPKRLGESTPSYLLYGAPVIERLRAVAPRARLLVMLREPVARAYSHFQMTCDPEGSPEQLRQRALVAGRSFEDLVDEDLALLEAAGVTGPDAPAEAFAAYAAALPRGHGCHAYVGRGLYALQLRPWLAAFARAQFHVEFVERMRTPEAMQAAMDAVFEFLEMPPCELAAPERYNTRSYDPISPEMAARLREYYAPFNADLQELLGAGLPLPW